MKVELNEDFVLRLEEPMISTSWSRELLENPMGDFIRLNCFTNGMAVTTLNKHYKLCSSYPQELVVPGELSDDILHSASQYRSRCRFPILSWRSNTTISGTAAVMCRCSQPMTGVTGKMSKKDEILLYALCARGTQPDAKTENEQNRKRGKIPKRHTMWDRSVVEAKDWFNSANLEDVTEELQEEEKDDMENLIVLESKREKFCRAAGGRN